MRRRRRARRRRAPSVTAAPGDRTTPRVTHAVADADTLHLGSSWTCTVKSRARTSDPNFGSSCVGATAVQVLQVRSHVYRARVWPLNLNRHGGCPETNTSVKTPRPSPTSGSWAYSNLPANVTRGVFAEYIFGLALTCVSGVRSAWGDCDLVTRAGTRVEVKAAAYLQSWRTETLETIGFGGLRGRAWDPVTGFAPEPSYRADVYVFALLTTVDHALLDPLATDQWELFVAPHAAVAARGVKRLSLTSVQQIANGPLRWDEIRQAVEAAAGSTDTPT